MRAGGGPSIPLPVVHRICSIYDPFCAHAAGARYPSQFSANTLTYQSRSIITATSSGAGNLFFAWSPDVNLNNYMAFAGAPGGATPASLTAADATNFAAWSALCRNMRIVSAGLRYIPSMASTVAPSIMQVGNIPDITTMLNQTMNYNDLYTFFSDMEIVSAADPYIYVLAPRSENAFDLISQSSASSTTRSGNWNCFVLAISAGAASANYNFELIVNYEAEPLGRPGLAINATQAPELASSSPQSKLVRAASDTLRSGINGFFQGTVQAFGKYVRRAAFNAAASAVGGALGGPKGAAMGPLLMNAIDVD
jgi:hypothetical protein